MVEKFINAKEEFEKKMNNKNCIDLDYYAERVKESQEAWTQANDKLVEFELKIKEMNIIKAQLKALLDNVSTSSEHLQTILEDLASRKTIVEDP